MLAIVATMLIGILIGYAICRVQFALYYEIIEED